MKIELIRQKFNDARGYKFKPFVWCCDKIKDNPCIVFSDEVYTDNDIDDKCSFPAFALWHSEVVKDWEDEYEQDTYYKINHCPFCGEPIEISIVGEEDVDDYYKSLSKQREELWKKYNKTDSKKEAQKLRIQVQELDNQINWLYQLAEYEKRKGEISYVGNDVRR